MANANVFTSMAGGFTTQNLAAAEGPATTIREVRVLDEKIHEVERHKSPLTTVLDVAKKMKGTQGSMDFERMIQYPIPRQITVTVAATATGVSLTLDSSDYVIAGHILVNPYTREQMYVTAINTSTNVATVTRGFGDCPSGAIPAQTTIQVTGLIGEEGQLAFKGVSRGVDSRKLYCEETGWGAGLTEWAAIRAYIGGGEEARISMQATMKFKEQVEQKNLMHSPHYAATGGINSQRVYASAGLRWLCYDSGNVVDLNGSLNYDAFADGLVPMLRWASSRSVLGLCGVGYLNELTRMPGFRNRVRTSAQTTDFGFEITALTFPKGGKIGFIAHEMYDDPGFERECLIWNADDVRRREARGFKLRRDVQTPGRHSKEWELSEIRGMEDTNPLALGVFRNA